MLSAKGEEFLQDILSFVKFPFDKAAIKSELESHLIDKIDDYFEQGYDQEIAEQLSIKDMGDAKEIGIELNKQHNPVIGWLWKITNILAVLFLIVNVYSIGGPLVHLLTSGNPVNDIQEANIVYNVEVDEKVKLDDMVIHVTNVVLEKNGDLNIIYEYYDTKLWGAGWSSSGIGKISDNLGNEYWSGSGSGSGGIISKQRRTVENFSLEADTLIISYDNYNRKYRIEIPLRKVEK